MAAQTGWYVTLRRPPRNLLQRIFCFYRIDQRASGVASDVPRFKVMSPGAHRAAAFPIDYNLASETPSGPWEMAQTRPHVRLSMGRPVSQYAGNEGCTG